LAHTIKRHHALARRSLEGRGGAPLALERQIVRDRGADGARGARRGRQGIRPGRRSIGLRCTRAYRISNAGKNTWPTTCARLPKQSGRGIPGVVVAIEQPAPFRNMHERHECRAPQRVGEVSDRVARGDTRSRFIITAALSRNAPPPASKLSPSISTWNPAAGMSSTPVPFCSEIRRPPGISHSSANSRSGIDRSLSKWDAPALCQAIPILKPCVPRRSRQAETRSGSAAKKVVLWDGLGIVPKIAG